MSSRRSSARAGFARDGCSRGSRPTSRGGVRSTTSSRRAAAARGSCCRRSIARSRALASATRSMRSPTRSRAVSTRRPRARRSRRCSATSPAPTAATARSAAIPTRVRIVSRERRGRAGARRRDGRVARRSRAARPSSASRSRFPVMDERTLAPLRRALEDEGIVASRSRAARRRRSAPVVAGALLALDAASVARSPRRRAAPALRLDRRGTSHRRGPPRRRAPPRAARACARDLGDGGGRGRRRATRPDRDARPERRASVARTTTWTRTTSASATLALATQLATILARARGATTRIEHVRAARALWTELGIGARAGRGGLAVVHERRRADRRSARREARDRARRARVGRARRRRSISTRRRRIASARSSSASMRRAFASSSSSCSTRRPRSRARSRGARSGSRGSPTSPATRSISSSSLDANEGVLPRDDAHDALVSEALAEAIARASRGAFVAPAPGGDARARAHARSPSRPPRRSRGPRVRARGRARAPRLRPRRSSTRSSAPASPSSRRSRAAAPSRASDVRVACRARARARGVLPRSRASAVRRRRRPRAAARRLRALLVGETGGAETRRSRSRASSASRAARSWATRTSCSPLARPTCKDELPDAREEGTLVHEVLAAAFLATRELWPRRPRPAEEILERRRRGGRRASSSAGRDTRRSAPIVRLRVRDAVRAVLARRDRGRDAGTSLSPSRRSVRAREPRWPALDLADDDVRLVAPRVDRSRRSRARRSRRCASSTTSAARRTVRDAASSLGETALQVPLYACVAGARARARPPPAPTSRRRRATWRPKRSRARAPAAAHGRARRAAARRQASPRSSVVRSRSSCPCASGALAPIPATRVGVPLLRGERRLPEAALRDGPRRRRGRRARPGGRPRGTRPDARAVLYPPLVLVDPGSLYALPKNLVLAASAGTGKTHALVGRRRPSPRPRPRAARPRTGRSRSTRRASSRRPSAARRPPRSERASLRSSSVSRTRPRPPRTSTSLRGGRAAGRADDPLSDDDIRAACPSRARTSARGALRDACTASRPASFALTPSSSGSGLASSSRPRPTRAPVPTTRSRARSRLDSRRPRRDPTASPRPRAASTGSSFSCVASSFSSKKTDAPRATSRYRPEMPRPLEGAMRALVDHARSLQAMPRVRGRRARSRLAWQRGRRSLAIEAASVALRGLPATGKKTPELEAFAVFRKTLGGTTNDEKGRRLARAFRIRHRFDEHARIVRDVLGTAEVEIERRRPSARGDRLRRDPARGARAPARPPRRRRGGRRRRSTRCSSTSSRIRRACSAICKYVTESAG